MAISFKTDASYGYNLLTMFGVSPSMVSAAKAEGVQVVQKSPGNFYVVSNSGAHHGPVAIKGQAISLAKNGTLAPMSKQAITHQFETALKMTLKNQFMAAPLTSPVSTLGAVGPVAPLPAPVGKLASSTAAPSVSFKGDLADAGTLGDTVPGTSAGAVYRVVAIFDGLNLAVRVKANTTSFRAAGSSMGKYKANLQSLGFSVKASYASAHYELSDKGLRDKTFGAIVGALGFSSIKGVAPLDQGAL